MSEHGLLLSDEERERFATWLEREAETNEGMVKHMASMKVPEPMMQRMRTEAMACRIVVARLRSTETMSIGGQ